MIISSLFEPKKPFIVPLALDTRACVAGAKGVWELSFQLGHLPSEYEAKYINNELHILQLARIDSINESQ